MKEVVLLIGPACAGKSTKIEKDFAEHNIISFDNTLMEYFVEAENYNAAQKRYQVLSKDEKKVLSLYSANKFLTSLLKGKDIVIDYTNLKAEERWEKWLQFIPAGYKKTAVVFDIPFEILLKRNEERNLQEGKHIPLQIMEMMRDSFEPLSPKEKDFFDEIIVVT